MADGFALAGAALTGVLLERSASLAADYLRGRWQRADEVRRQRDELYLRTMHVLVSMPQLLTEAWIKDPDSVSEEFARLWRELKTDLMILASTKVQRSVIDLQQIYSNDFTARWGELAEQNSARNEDERRGFDQVWMKAFDEVMGPPLRRLAQAMRRELRLGRDEPPMVFS